MRYPHPGGAISGIARDEKEAEMRHSKQTLTGWIFELQVQCFGKIDQTPMIRRAFTTSDPANILWTTDENRQYFVLPSMSFLFNYLLRKDHIPGWMSQTDQCTNSPRWMKRRYAEDQVSWLGLSKQKVGRDTRNREWKHWSVGRTRSIRVSSDMTALMQVNMCQAENCWSVWWLHAHKGSKRFTCSFHTFARVHPQTRDSFIPSRAAITQPNTNAFVTNPSKWQITLLQLWPSWMTESWASSGNKSVGVWCLNEQMTKMAWMVDVTSGERHETWNSAIVCDAPLKGNWYGRPELVHVLCVIWSLDVRQVSAQKVHTGTLATFPVGHRITREISFLWHHTILGVQTIHSFVTLFIHSLSFFILSLPSSLSPPCKSQIWQQRRQKDDNCQKQGHLATPRGSHCNL